MASAELTERLEAAVVRLERAVRKLGGGGGDEEDGGVPEFVTQWEAFVATEVAKVVETAKTAGIPDYPDVILTAFTNTTEFIKALVVCKKPVAGELTAALEPISTQLAASGSLKYKASKDFKDHYVACDELVQVLQWLVIAPPMGTTGGHVKAQKEAVEFNLNRVIKKKSDADTKAWNIAMRKLMARLQDYVKEFFSMGLTWNPKGISVADYKGGASSGSAKKAAPKKAAATKTAAKADDSKSSGATGTSAVFAELSKGLSVTKGLKKVEDKDKTKYRTDRSGKVAAPKKKAAKKKRKKGAAVTKYLGGRWMIENYDDAQEVMDKADSKQNVYIAMCDDTVVEVKGKVKSVTLDALVKCQVFVDEVISTVELINCKSTTVIIKGKVPTVSCDKCQSPHIILTPEAFADPPEVYTSNVSAMNIEIPGPEADSDPVDVPVPEQFITKIDPKTREVKTTEVLHG
jgi:adenylyl cyclase-associated protein